MDEQIIREIIINQKDESKEMLKGVIKRQIPDLSVYIKNPNILTVMGIRRCVDNSPDNRFELLPVNIIFLVFRSLLINNSQPFILSISSNKKTSTLP